MASPDPAVEERQYWLTKLGISDDPALSMSDLKAMTGGGARVDIAANQSAQKVLDSIAKAKLDSIMGGDVANLVAAVANKVAKGSLVVNVRDYGAVPDCKYAVGSQYVTTPTVRGTDNTTAINNAVAAAAAISGTLFFPAGPEGDGYRTTATIAIPSNVSVQMDYPIIGDFTNGTIVKWGTGWTAGGANGPFQRKSVFSVTRYAQDPGDISATIDPTVDAVGLHLSSLHFCYVDVVMSARNQIGVLTEGDNIGFDYNYVRLGRLRDNAIHHYVRAVGTGGPSGSGGWHNQNLFVEPSFANGGTPTKKRVAIRMDTGNNNVWTSPSFEMCAAFNDGGQEVLAWEITDGYSNHIVDARLEGTSRVCVKTHGTAIANRFHYLYSVADYPRPSSLDDGLYPTTVIEDGTYAHHRENVRLVTKINAAAQRCTYYAANGGVHIPGMSWMIFGAPQIQSRTNSTDVRLGTTGAVEISPGASYGGVYVSTADCKRLIAEVDSTDKNLKNAWVVFAFADDGTRVTTAGALTSDGLGFNYNSSNGGFWATSLQEKPLYLSMTDEVKYVFIAISSGKFKSFSVFSPVGSNAPASWCYGPNDNRSYASVSPVRGVYDQSREILRYPQAVGQTRGWIVTTSGGASEALWAATTAYTVGQWIRLSTGKVLECTTAGTSAAAEPIPGTLNTTVTDGTVTWIYRAATLAVFTALPNL